MSLNLDPRQRAMLQEMGVHVWLPDSTQVHLSTLQNDTKNIAASAGNISARGTFDAEISAVKSSAKPLPVATAPESSAAISLREIKVTGPATPTSAPQTTPQAVAQAVAAKRPSQVTVLPANISAMDWLQLHDAVAQCQACAMCLGRRAAVLTAPEPVQPCDWLLVGDPPDEAQERVGAPFVDDAGVLLDNMLRAVGVQRCPTSAQAQPSAGVQPTPAPRSLAYLTHVLKCRPALNRAPTAQELATCAHYLRREIALTQPKVIVAMGRFAMQTLLTDTPPEHAHLPLGKLRGQVWRFAGVPLVVTYPPSYLLRQPQDKARAWVDVCLALDVVQGRQA